MKTENPGSTGAGELFNLSDVLKILYQALIESIKDPFRILDDNYRLLWINQDWPCQSVGKICYEDIFQRDTPCPDCPVTKAFETGKPAITIKRVTQPDGSESKYEVRAYPVFDSDGRIAYGITIGHDYPKDQLDPSERQDRIDRLQKALYEITQQHVDDMSIIQPSSSLTKREHQVLHLVAEGMTNPEISKVLSISPHTVKTHVIRIFDKLGVSDRTQAATLATRLKLI